MGTNKRYAHVIDRRMDEKILERAAQEGPLQTLTPAELRLDILPVTIDPQPRTVKAWVRFGPRAVIVDALLDRWTTDACGIRFMVAGVEMKCWVYGPAVQAPTNDESAPGRPSR